MSKWTTNDIPDLTGKVIIVTGSTSGIGKETAREVAKKNATTIMAIRNLEKGKKVKEELLTEYPDANLFLLKLDLSDLTSIKDFVLEFNQQFQSIHYLINNAGVMMPPYSQTKDGFELQMGTNHLGHFALTGLLFPLLKKTKGSSIINVSSMAHRAGNIDFDDLDWTKRKYNRSRAYGDSKIANLYFTYELQRIVNQQKLDVIVTAAHPGWSATELQRHAGPLALLNIVFGQKPSKGALPTLRAAFDPQKQGGDYYGPRGLLEFGGYPKKVNSNKRSHQNDTAKRLFEVSTELTKVTF